MLIGGNHYLEPPPVISVAWLRALAALVHQTLVSLPTDVIQDDLLGHFFWRSQSCCHINSPGDLVGSALPIKFYRSSLIEATIFNQLILTAVTQANTEYTPHSDL